MTIAIIIFSILWIVGAVITYGLNFAFFYKQYYCIDYQHSSILIIPLFVCWPAILIVVWHESEFSHGIRFRRHPAMNKLITKVVSVSRYGGANTTFRGYNLVVRYPYNGYCNVTYSSVNAAQVRLATPQEIFL